MAALITKAELITLAFNGSVTALVGVSDATITMHLERASARVLGALPAQVGELDPILIPLEVKGYVADLAAWPILVARGSDPRDPAMEARRDAFNNALADLKMIGAGKLSISLPDATPDVAEGAPAAFSNEPRGW